MYIGTAYKRILFDLTVIFSAFFMPYWLIACLVIFGILAFRYYMEGVLVALLSSFLFAPPNLPIYKNLLLIVIGLLVAREIFIKNFLRPDAWQ